MCNEFEQERLWRDYCQMMQAEALNIVTDEPPGLPFGTVRPSDPAAIIRAAPGGARLDVLRWGWAPQGGKGLVINIRSENRRDPPQGRGIAPVSRFFEFGEGRPPKPKWAFSAALNEPLAVGVVVRGDRFAFVTTEPGFEVGAVHDRQPVLLKASDWHRWLTEPAWPADLAVASPEGTLRAVKVR